MNKSSNLESQHNQTLDQSHIQLRSPSQFKVILLNDDFTPMEFVVQVLKYFFAMDDAKAVEIMLQVHQQGKGVCGIYTRDIAETKAAQVRQFAQHCEHPLLCDIEVL